MNNQDVIEAFEKEFGSDRLGFNEPMSHHTTFRIGGPADFYFEAKTPIEIQKVLKICRENRFPYFVIGVGANLLVWDRGI